MEKATLSFNEFNDLFRLTVVIFYDLIIITFLIIRKKNS